MYLFSLFFVFLSIAYRVNCGGKSPSCTGTFVDRYCALDDKEGENQCEENLGIHKDVRIADLCFDAMVKNGYKLSTEEKLKKLCNLKPDEYDAFNLCYTTAMNLDLKRGGKKYHGVEHCLSKIEKKENKQCEYSYFKPPTSSDKPEKSKVINVKAENNPWSKIPWNSEVGNKNPWYSGPGNKNPWNSSPGSKNPWNSDSGSKNPWNSETGSKNPWNSGPWIKEISIPTWQK